LTIPFGALRLIECFVLCLYRPAARWYQQAIDKGEVTSMTNLAQLYEDGRGVRKDHGKAIQLMREAAAAGNEDAAQWLAVHGADK
jgi:TPR repeat protein